MYASGRGIILLDDPLSALDANVKRRVFDRVILDHLKDKTRVLVTHAVEFLDRADRVIIMKGGRIVQNGTYGEVIETQEFQEIVR